MQELPDVAALIRGDSGTEDSGWEHSEREPRNPNALFYLGLLLQGTGKVREALDLFLKLTERNPSNAGAHAHVGHALARLGEPEKGIDYLRYAMRLSPKDTNLADDGPLTGGPPSLLD
jgi:tetratricopeptide (TPR) repeat protein